jgi:hypothetical protein
MDIISKAFSVSESVRTETAAMMKATSVPLIHSTSTPRRAGAPVGSVAPGMREWATTGATG